MTAQTPPEVKNVLTAYAFLVKYRGRIDHPDGAIATSKEEALADLSKQYHFLDAHGELEFISTGFAVMQPALIERSRKDVKVEGLYAFLGGMFFVAYEDQRLVYRCAQRKMPKGWAAIIYSGSYYITPR